MIPNIVLGTMEFGRRLTGNQCLDLMTKFSALGYKELDTASIYASGSTERILGEFSQYINENKLQIATKAIPSYTENGFSSTALRQQFSASLESLNQRDIDIYYLHWPSRCDPLEETLETIHNLYREGKFKRFGLSNYSSWEVMKIWQLCDKNDWIRPTIYQGMYNVLTRDAEKELIPCIHDLGMSFYAYNPLAGGILSGRYKYDDLSSFNDDTTPNRFYKIGGNWAISYQNRFWKRNYFEALKDIENILRSYSCVGSEPLSSSSTINADTTFSTPNHDLLRLAFSWLLHSSMLDSKYGDALIIGASSVKQFDQNMNIILNDRLQINNEFNAALDSIYKKHIGGCCPLYFR